MTNMIPIYKLKNPSKLNLPFRQLLLENDVQEIAEKTGFKYHTIHKYKCARTNVPAFFIPIAYHGTGDIRWLEQIINPCGFTLVDRACPSCGSRSVNKDKSKLPIRVGRIFEIIERIYADKKVTKQEYKEIHAELNAFRRRCAKIDLKIEKEIRL